MDFSKDYSMFLQKWTSISKAIGNLKSNVKAKFHDAKQSVSTKMNEVGSKVSKKF